MTSICAFHSQHTDADAAGAVAAMLRLPHRDRSAFAHARPSLNAYCTEERVAAWSGGGVALGIRTRSVLPEDRFDREPDAADRVVLVADIRLDNRDELRRKLTLDMAATRTMADSAMLRAAWLRWGMDCVQHLIGDFAFVVWNEAERTLFCARDALGVRPLCYTRTGGALAVGSTPAEVLQLPWVSAAPDALRLGAHLLLLPQDGGRTYYRDVAQVPAGHALILTPSGVQVQRWWTPAAREIRFPRDDDYAAAFLEVFDEAVASRLRACGPVASMLSGGFDSGSVTAAAAIRLARDGSPLRAVTWSPAADADVPGATARVTDEFPLAAAVAAQHANIEHLRVEAPDQQPLCVAARFTAAVAQPFLNPILAPSFLATGERLAGSGCRVLLTGQNGNATISYAGAGLLPALLRRGRMLRFVREAHALRPRQSWPSLLRRGIAPLWPVPVLNLLRRLRHGAPRNWFGVHPEFARRHVLPLARRLAWSPLHGPPDDGRGYRMALLQRIDQGVPIRSLQAVLGLDVRDPTSDLRVVEFCFAIPTEQYLHLGTNRWLLRRAMADRLPPAVLNETRRGLQGSDWPRFVAPYRAAFTAELDAIERSPLAREALDLPLLRRLLINWPTTWTHELRGDYAVLLLRALSIGRFILDTDGPRPPSEGAHS